MKVLKFFFAFLLLILIALGIALIVDAINEMNWEMIVGGASTLIALCALFTAIYYGYQMRKHNKISVRPFLTIWSSTGSNSGSFVIDVINNGIGPALIKEFIVKVDRSVIKSEREQQVKDALDIIAVQISQRSIPVDAV